jgi:hypothetical protein
VHPRQILVTSSTCARVSGSIGSMKVAPFDTATSSMIAAERHERASVTPP